jgi:hypothetical protein
MSENNQDGLRQRSLQYRGRLIERMRLLPQLAHPHRIPKCLFRPKRGKAVLAARDLSAAFVLPPLTVSIDSRELRGVLVLFLVPRATFVIP